jgi:hypothetical protein
MLLKELPSGLSGAAIPFAIGAKGGKAALILLSDAVLKPAVKGIPSRDRPYPVIHHGHRVNIARSNPLLKFLKGAIFKHHPHISGTHIRARSVVHIVADFWASVADHGEGSVKPD